MYGKVVSGCIPSVGETLVSVLDCVSSRYVDSVHGQILDATLRTSTCISRIKAGCKAGREK